MATLLAREQAQIVLGLRHKCQRYENNESVTLLLTQSPAIDIKKYYMYLVFFFVFSLWYGIWKISTQLLVGGANYKDRAFFFLIESGIKIRTSDQAKFVCYW